MFFRLTIETEYPYLKRTIKPDFIEEPRFIELMSIDRDWIKHASGSSGLIERVVGWLLVQTISPINSMYGQRMY